MPLTASRCDYLRQILGEVAWEGQWEFLWCVHYGIDYASLFHA